MVSRGVWLAGTFQARARCVRSCESVCRVLATRSACRIEASVHIGVVHAHSARTQCHRRRKGRRVALSHLVEPRDERVHSLRFGHECDARLAARGGQLFTQSRRRACCARIGLEQHNLRLWWRHVSLAPRRRLGQRDVPRERGCSGKKVLPRGVGCNVYSRRCRYCEVEHVCGCPPIPGVGAGETDPGSGAATAQKEGRCQRNRQDWHAHVVQIH